MWLCLSLPSILFVYKIQSSILTIYFLFKGIITLVNLKNKSLKKKKKIKVMFSDLYTKKKLSAFKFPQISHNENYESYFVFKPLQSRLV